MSLSRCVPQPLQAHSLSFKVSSLFTVPQLEQVFDEGSNLPRLSISQIVRRLKQESTRQLWLSHHSTLRQYYWHRKILWSDGFFVCSIGEASPETIRQYILTQG